MKPRAKIGDYVMVLQKRRQYRVGISPTNTSGYKY
ncbi:N-acetyl-gamma-glutamyl-phosphate reductase [Escherichia coli]|nr:N-acetyl-gamma-glutamyl-phosphate reductase [Escherichia coli]